MFLSTFVFEQNGFFVLIFLILFINYKIGTFGQTD